MNLVFDESVDFQIINRVRSDGHQVISIAETEPGSTDELVLKIANDHGSLLVTADKDFGELVFRLRKISSGVLLLRLSGLRADRKADFVSNVLRQYGHTLCGAFSVLSPGVVRIRSGQ